MAAPHVSGVAALLISAGKANTPDQVRNILQQTAEDKGTPGKDDVYGWGLVNAAAALGIVGPTPTLTPVPTASSTATPIPTATPTPRKLVWFTKTKVGRKQEM
jgi:subtilisin family serine protease